MRKFSIFSIVGLGTAGVFVIIAIFYFWPEVPSWVAPIATMTVLGVAILQLELTRRKVFGELYENAKISNLQFFVPAKEKYEVSYQEQDLKSHNMEIGKNIEIPAGKEVELFVFFEFEETQSLRSFEIHFQGDITEKPKILGSDHGFVKKSFRKTPISEAVDWNNTYHREYANKRKIAKGQPFIVSITVEGQEKGDFPLKFWVYTEEAKEAYEGILELTIS